MIEIEIPQDITKYESKLIGPFTTRQLICLVGLVGGCVASYKAITSILGNESPLKMIIPMIVAVPFALIGWYKPYGMYFEKFIKSIFIFTFVAPTKRLYKIENVYDEFDKIIDKEEKEKIEKTNPQAQQKNKKKHTNKKTKGAG